MIQGYAWVCGEQYYSFLPSTYAGCCYLVEITTPFTLIPVQDLLNLTHVPGPGHHPRKERSMAEFSSRDFYHYRVSLGEKWGIGLFPWYGVTFLANHLDNITADLYAYMTANTAAVTQLNNAGRNHRDVVFKHEMILDYLFASEGGMCKALDIPEHLCCVLAPDLHDNITQLINVLATITSHFKASDKSGWSAMDWLHEHLGPWGTMVFQILTPIVVVLAIMICFCTVLLACVRALVTRYVEEMVGQYTQLSLYRDG